MSKKQVDPLIAAIAECKLFAMQHLPKRAATFHALDAAASIAGWDLAHEKGSKFDLAARVKEVYKNAMGTS